MTRLKTSTRRLLHRRTTGFRPAKYQLSILLVLPFQVKAAVVIAQRPVFGGIGRQLVQRYGNRLGSGRLQQGRWTVDAHAPLVLLAIRSKLLGGDRR